MSGKFSAWPVTSAMSPFHWLWLSSGSTDRPITLVSVSYTHLDVYKRQLHDRIRAAWDAFAEFLDRDTPPPLADADQRQRDDEAWHLAAKAYQTAKAEADQATAGVDATRAALVALARHLRESGACVSVTGFRKACLLYTSRCV